MAKIEPLTKAQALSVALDKFFHRRTPDGHLLIEQAAKLWLDSLGLATEIQRWRNS